ncbi:hemagglutinin, partial [Neisseria meningitidis]
ETVSSSKSALWQKQAGRGSNIETLQLPSFTGPVAPVLSAPGGYIVDIPKGNLKTQIETLTKQPEYAYLKQLQVAKNINWNQVQLAYDKWDYKQEGMTPAAAAVVVIVVTVLTYGALSAPAAAGTAGAAGAGAGGAAAGTAAGTGVAAGTAATTGVAAGTSAAAITTAAGKAALASLASQAAVSLINNKGDINHTLKELGKSSTVRQAATAAVTAGVLQGISGLNTQAAEAVSKHFHSPAAGKLTANLINSTAAASVHTAINGGSLKDNLGDAALGAIVSTVHGEVASKIKFNLSEDYIAHKIAHAVAGCASAVANKGKCRDGAIGAAVGEILGETLLDGRDPGSLNVKDRAKIIAKAKLAAGTVAALSKGDVNAAANAAAVAVESNALSKERMDKLTKCLSGKTC